MCCPSREIALPSASPTTPPPASVAAFAIPALILGAMAMGISPIFVRLTDVGPFASAFWRVALCLPVLYVWMRIEEAKAPKDKPKVRFAKANVLAARLELACMESSA